MLRFLSDTPGAEALGIGYAAAFMRAAPAEVLNGDDGVEALDALGGFADRLAQRASSGAQLSRSAQAALAAHLDVAAGYGVRFVNYERDGRSQLCYDGDAFRRVLAMRSTPEQRARAALALTRAGMRRPRPAAACARASGRVARRSAGPGGGGRLARLPEEPRADAPRRGVEQPRLRARAHRASPPLAAAARAIAELAGIDKSELADADRAGYADAAMRANASRWAAAPAPAQTASRGVRILTAPGAPGETCVTLVDASKDGAAPLAKRCTYSLVWADSATRNREGTALALAVQPLAAWRELWLFRKEAHGWAVRVLPPSARGPEVGYAEFAGWVPGGRQMLVAREAGVEGKYQRSFELMRLDTLATERQAQDPDTLGAFRRWQDPRWKRLTLSVR